MRPLNYNTPVLDEEGDIFELTQYIEDHGGGGGGSITVDAELSLTSKNPVQNKVITAALNAQKVTVDDMLSDSSENPVQNKVIKEALDAQKVTVDDTLSDSSTNPVQNKVIKEALTWKLLGTTIGSYNFSAYNEILIALDYSNNKYTFSIPVIDLENDYKFYENGGYQSNTGNYFLWIRIKKTDIIAYFFMQGGTDRTNSTNMKIYAR